MSAALAELCSATQPMFLLSAVSSCVVAFAANSSVHRVVPLFSMSIFWKKYTIALDVPEDSKQLAYGIMVAGEGKAWMKDFTLVEERILELDEMEDDDEAAGAFKIGNARYNFNFWGDEHEDVYDEEAGRRWPGGPGPMPGQGPSWPGQGPNRPPGQFRL